MAVQYNPGIDTTGLILNLDVGNIKNYPSTGFTFSDSLNSSQFTLLNGPVYSSLNGGRLTFDGTNDYAESVNRILEFQPTQPFSVFCWFRGPFTGSPMMANMDNSGVYPGWDFGWITVAGALSIHLISSWSTNAIKIHVTGLDLSSAIWQYFGFTYDGSCPTTAPGCLSSINFYLNGSLYTTGKAMVDGTDGFSTSSDTITYNTSQRFRLASRWAAGAVSSAGAVTLGPVHCYNRVLNAEQVRQNFNALRGRFGI